MKKMNTILKTVVLLILLVSTAYGQTETNQEESIVGKKALLFQMGYNLNLSAFDGRLLSIKKQLTEQKAWRIGISLNGFHTKGEELIRPDTLFVVSDDDESNIDVAVSLAYQYYANPKDIIRFYYGYGMRIGFLHQWTNSVQYYNDNVDAINIGPIGFVGVEWFVHKQISLSGEYGSYLYYSYRFRKYKLEDQKDITTKDHTVGILQDNVKLGLSVYF